MSRLVPWPRAAWVSLLLALLVAVGLPVATGNVPAASASVTAGEVVFERTLAGPPNHPSQIVVRNGSGGITNLSNNSFDEHTPDVSPDGSRIAFISNRRGAGYQELWVMNSDGSGAAQLTMASSSNDFSDAFPRWSPDGTKIAYMRSAAGTVNIWVIDADDPGTAEPLTSDGRSFDPTWSPDGSMIAYEHMQSSSDQAHIWLMDADGADPHSVVATPGDYNEHYPVWSPDGSRIYYNSYTAGYGFWYFNSTDDFATTGSVTRVSVSGANNINGPARFSADGNTLVFNGQGSSGCYQIYTIPASGGTRTALTTDNCSAQNFNASYVMASWSPKKLVVLGDSFSSGEGNPTFIAPSDSNGCHRSTKAYARVLAETPVGMSPVDFVACSGATTANVIAGRNGEDPQLDAIASDADLVILTIGGNDAEFAEFVTDCVLSNCAGSGQYDDTMDRIENAVPDNLDTLFYAIQGVIGEDTRVLVLGYPRMLPYGESEGSSCLYLTGDEPSAVADVETGLNTAISAAVDRAGASFEFVDADAVYNNLRISPFAGHELCSSGSFFNGLDVWNQEYSFHPNEEGQEAYAQLIVQHLSNNP